MQAEEYRSETREVAGVKLNLTCYKIGNAYHCHLANVDPGATIARATAATAAEAEALALQKARERLKVKAV
ncbi:MAG: hypothetical protein DKINENOH_00227 [bacterium]|nr:hypothetical protein [bacterium]